MGSLKTGIARNASRKASLASPGRSPWRISWTTGPQVTKLDRCSSVAETPLRPAISSIHTDVSTRIIWTAGSFGLPDHLDGRIIWTNGGGAGGPPAWMPGRPHNARAKETRKALNLLEADHFLKRGIDRGGIGFGAQNPGGLLQQLVV